MKSVLNDDFLGTFGIVDFGYTEDSLPLSFDFYADWVKEKKHGPLKYLSDHRKDLRKDIKLFFPEFKSALVFLFDYSAEKKKLDEFYRSHESNGLKIGSFAFGFNGEDYHKDIRKKLGNIAEALSKTGPDLKIQYSLDIHPVLERDLAYRSGLGWFGKNSMLIHKKEGSFFIIGSLLLNKTMALEKKKVETDHCGNCSLCIDLCPTDAIDMKSRTIKSDFCISTWTIEMFKEAKQIEGHPEKSSGEIFGCDICQDVCPWNKKKLSKVAERPLDNEQSELLRETFLKRPPEEIYSFLNSLSNSKFKKIFKNTPLGRTGREGMMKNIKIFL